MRNTLAAAAVLGTLALAPVEAAATEIGSGRAFGLGLQLGTPSGISGKLYLGGRANALDFSLGAWYGDVFYDTVYGQVSYHWHFVELTSGSGVAIPLRIGGGGWFASGYWRWGRGYYSDVIIGGRVPFGVDFDLEAAPVQFFIEVAFSLAIIPTLGSGFDASIGARYYF